MTHNIISASPPPSSSCFKSTHCQHGINYGTGSIQIIHTGTYQDCCTACAAQPECKAWDWNEDSGGDCYLKDNSDTSSKENRYVMNNPQFPHANANANARARVHRGIDYLSFVLHWTHQVRHYCWIARIPLFLFSLFLSFSLSLFLSFSLISSLVPFLLCRWSGTMPANVHSVSHPPPPPAPPAPESQPGFDDSGWLVVDAPHDMLINQQYDPANSKGMGYLPRGSGWYRKHFALPAEWKGKAVWLYIEGAFHTTTAYLNGAKVRHGQPPAPAPAPAHTRPCTYAHMNTRTSAHVHTCTQTQK